MPMQISFELDDQDLRHFELIMREARKVAANAPPEVIVDGAKTLLDQIDHARVPQFIRDRLDNLHILIRMIGDHEWRLPDQDATRVLNALAYFRDPEDLIPDHIPGLGFLDDAIMVQLVLDELRHEIEAYNDFCEFRNSSTGVNIRAKSSKATRDEWLANRRLQLQARMQSRRREK